MIPDITEYLSSLKSSAKFGPQIVCHRDFPAKEAQYATEFPPLDNAFRTILKKTGIYRLYSHQCRAVCSILNGQDVIVAKAY